MLRSWLVALACAELCARLLYESGHDRGFSENCRCCERGECDDVSKKTLPAMTVTATLREPVIEIEYEPPPPGKLTVSIPDRAEPPEETPSEESTY